MTQTSHSDDRSAARSRPLKVLLLSLYHPEIVRGGAQQVCFDLFSELEERDDVDATLLAAIDPSLSAFYKTGAVITGFDGRDRQFLYLSRDYDYQWHKTSSRRAVEALAEFLRITNPDVVHVHHFLLFGIDVLTLIRRTVPGARIVFTFHEFMALCHADGHLLRRTDGSICPGPSMVRCSQCFPDLAHSYFFLREQWFRRHLQSADVLTVPSPFMIDRWRTFGLDADRIVCVSNGLPEASMDPVRETEHHERQTFGFFGQLVDVKGVGLILEAVDILARQGFDAYRIEINGDNLRFASDALRHRVEDAMAEAAGGAPGAAPIAFNGAYGRADLQRRMRRVDWCLIPSLWPETHCLVLSEAWAHGVVPIAADVGALGDRISHDKNGLLFSVGDAHSLADAIRRAASDPDLRARLAGAAPAQMTAREMTNAYLSVYRDAFTPAAQA